MQSTEFDKIMEEELDYIRSLLATKKTEYNLTEDRFDAFKHGADITGWTPEQALLGYWSKHLVSIVDMINSKQTFSKERWKEKITDSINYSLLLLGLVEDTGRSTSEAEAKINVISR